MNAIFDHPNPRHVSTDRLNREDSQLVTSLEIDSIPAPAGKTLPPQNQVLEGESTRLRKTGRIANSSLALYSSVYYYMASDSPPSLSVH